MKFQFEIAPFLEGADRERTVSLLAQVEELERSIDPMLLHGPLDVLHCWVIDVCPQAREPVELVEWFEKLLSGALVEMEPFGQRERGGGVRERFVFLGSTDAVDSWEVEEEHSVHATKKALELFIRALQSADIAHYGNVRRKPGPDSENPLDKELARSALIGLGRYYRKRQGDEHPTIVAGLEALRGDIKRLFDHVREREPLLDAPGEFVPPNRQLMVDINSMFQLGKRETKRSYAAVARSTLLPDDMRAAGGTYLLREELNKLLTTPNHHNSGRIKDLVVRLRRYELLRDLGRCIGSASLSYLRARADSVGSGMLIIDDDLYAEMGGERRRPDVKEKLEGVIDIVGWKERCFVCPSDVLAPIENISDLHGSLSALARPIEVSPLSDSRKVQTSRIEDFRLVLVEVDSTRQLVGPRAVHRLARYIGSLPADQRPAVIVLTRTESFGHIQQSLNLGADSYVLKERLYQLPFQMRRALEGRRNRRFDTEYLSAFRGLGALRPEVRAKLHREEAPSLVYGGAATPGGRAVPDSREARWIRELPKSDLHFHLGTSLPYSATHALALNTSGHVMSSEGEDYPTGVLANVIDKVAQTVVLAEMLVATNTKLPPMIALALAASTVTHRPLDQLPRFGLGDAVASWLVAPTDGLRDFEVIGLLVGVIHLKRKCDRKRGSAWSAKAIRTHFERLASDIEPELDASLVRVGLAARRRRLLAKVNKRIVRIARRWIGADTCSAFEPFKALPEDSSEPMAIIGKATSKRIKRASKVLREARKRAWSTLRAWKRDAKRTEWLTALSKRLHLDLTIEWPSEGETAPRRLTLERYVQLPELPPSPTPEQYGLSRYLWGADLLGASHLQYPENLLLAARAVVYDNALDNVVYSEVRCETTGYTHAGMTALDATDLMCLSFDLAAMQLHLFHPLPLVRTNVLLAAKRHKGAAAAREAVALMEHYLRIRMASEPADPGLPAWWRPSRVVGFDISGDETRQAEWLEKTLDPLALLSSPITIHAGEAATAASIWDAVHRLHARRIGHGLRLREDMRLLGYCVDEGICMEMCPNSNVFTNAYFPAPNGHHITSAANPRAAYPLREYMQAGLEVAIATDNRYLHDGGSHTLTSEYMTAARLSDGLTRWEILQLVKAGFKNAFLPKKEVAALVSAVEERIYRVIARGWF